jgi:hypothetical protein
MPKYLGVDETRWSYMCLICSDHTCVSFVEVIIELPVRGVWLSEVLALMSHLRCPAPPQTA